MTLPGVEITNQDARVPSGPNLRLATVFAVGELQKGEETAIAIRSLRDLERYCGERTTDTAPMHDWLDLFYREGGGIAYVTPLRGPAAAAASAIFSDGSATAITVAAKEKGSWGNGAANGLSVDIDVYGGNFEVKVYLDGVLVETTGMVADGAAAASWSTTATYVTITDGPGVDPTATGSPTNLAGGDDDFDGITNTEITDALARFSPDLGPGSVVLPGRSSTSPQLLAQAHAAANNRLARHEAAATSVVATLTAQAATLQAGGDADYAELLAPRLTILGLTPSTTRSVSATALRCACEARNDAEGISPNQPAAGRWGVARWAVEPTIEWDEDDRETLNDGGVNVARVVREELKLYGARTLADADTAPAALRIGSARLRMAITEIARSNAEETVFAEIDQGGVVLGDLIGRVRGGILQYERSLYALDVTAEVVDGDVVGEYILEVAIEFQAAPDAERVRVVITRAVTEV